MNPEQFLMIIPKRDFLKPVFLLAAIFSLFSSSALPLTPARLALPPGSGLTITGAVPTTIGALSKIGAGTLSLNGANQYSGGDGSQRWPTGVKAERRNHSGQRDCRSNRKVDPAADDDQRHADRADRPDDGLRQDNAQVECGKVSSRRLHQDREDHDHQN